MGKNEKTKDTEGKRYKTLAKLDQNLWTYGSPIIIEQGILESDTISNKNLLTLEFTNIYQQEIKDVYLTIFVSDAEGNEDQIDHGYRALHQKFMSKKGSAKITIYNKEARDFKIRIEQINFEDGRVWTKENARLESAGKIEDLEKFATDKLEEYQDTYEQGLSQLESDRPDTISDGIKELKKVSWYMDADEILEEANRKFEAARMNEERKRQRADNRVEREKLVKKRFKVTVVAVVALFVLAIISVIAFFIPNSQFNAADKLIEAKKYEQAAEKFKGLRPFIFRDARGKEAQCYYNIGLAKLDKNDEKNAKVYFGKGYEVAPNSDYGKMSGAFLDYYAGVDALAKRDIETAYKKFKASSSAAVDIALTLKATSGLAEILLAKKDFKNAWDAIGNVYAKEDAKKSGQYSDLYGKIGYAYAKHLIDTGKTEQGLKVYNQIAKYSKAENLNESIYRQAQQLAGHGQIDAAMTLLEKTKNYRKANILHEKLYDFDQKVKGWLGIWKHRAKIRGDKKTFKIIIKEKLFKGDMCLVIQDIGNKNLSFKTVISKKNGVSQITIGEYMIKFKLNRFGGQKHKYALKEPGVMTKTLKYGGDKIKQKFKKSGK